MPSFRHPLQVDLGRGIAVCPDSGLDEALRRILKGTIEAVGAPIGMIFLKDPQTKVLTLAASVGLSTESPAKRWHWHLQQSEGLIGDVDATGQPVFLELDYSHDLRAHQRVAEAEKLNSFIGVPINDNGECVGVMSVFTRPPDVLDERQIPVVTALGEVLGAAIREARLLDACMRARDDAKSTCDLFDTITRCIDDGIAVIESDLSISYANQAFANQAGMEVDEILGKTCFWVSHKRDKRCEPPEHECPMQSAYDTGRPQTAIHRHIDKVGGSIWVEVSCSPVFDTDGTIVRAVEVTRDITRRKTMEQDLLDAEKLAALGEMASTMAHEIRNPLAGMKGALEVISSKDETQPYAGVLRDVMEQIDRLSETAGSLLSFARPIAPRQVPTDLSKVIRKAHSLFEDQARRQGTEVILELDTSDRLLLLDPQITARALLNIALNALQAMGSGGRLIIRSRRDSEVGVATVSLTDEGPGMSPEVLEKIFTPFFSTKVRGTGLGLCVVKEIVERQGGAVEVTSEPGKGTTFVVTLPMARGGSATP